MKRMLLCCMAWLMLGVVPALAQNPYGTGVEVSVPRVSPGTLTMDGVADEPIWDLAPMFDLVQYANFFTEEVPDPDIAAEGRVLYTEDTLYVFVQMFDNAFFTNPDEPYESDQILIGIDGVHEAGVTDVMVDEGFGGWPANAPDLGPTTYKIYNTGDGGTITLNWGFDDVDPVAEGWARGTVFQDEETLEWGVELAIYVPQIEAGAEIGFNIGGAQGSDEIGFAYGFFSWQVVDPDNPGSAGGDVMSQAASFATLVMEEPSGGGEGYGTGIVVQVPMVDPSEMTMDGVADEPAWDMATTFDLVQYANFFTEEVPDPDIAAEGRVLWSEDTLYVFVQMFDNAFFTNPDEPYESDQILIGIDGVHEDGVTDVLADEGFGGWPANAPDLGPTTYKIYNTGDGGTITLNWGFDGIFPVDSMWVNGTVFQDENALEWGVEVAIYVPQIALGEEIGFNIGGAQGSDEIGFAYGFFSWQVVDPDNPGSAGGDVMSQAASFATLQLVEEVSQGIEEEVLDGIPDRFVLDQNYPNPFNPATTIEYGLDRAGFVAIDVFNLLGQKVATLIDAAKPAGTYRVRWDAEDLPSGIYLYQLRVDGQVAQSRTMMLLK